MISDHFSGQVTMATILQDFIFFDEVFNTARGTGRSKFKELLAAGAPRHPIGRFRPRRPGGSGTFSNFELWAPEVAF